MTPEDRARMDALPPLQRSVTAILMTLLDEHSGPDAVDKSLNPPLAVDACLMVVAALIEVDVGNQTTRDMRVSIDTAAEMLRKMTKRMRADFEETGKHGLELIGATDVRTSAIN